jgi:hypothetical protein
MIFERLKKYIFGHTDRDMVSRQASSLLQSDAFLIAYESVQEGILEKIVASNPADADKREKLYLQYKALEDVVYELKRLINQSDQPDAPESDQGGI